MGKDKHTFKQLSIKKETFYKELKERCENDCFNVLQTGGLQTDLSRECWLKGFSYAFERINAILELKEEKRKWKSRKSKTETVITESLFLI